MGKDTSVARLAANTRDDPNGCCVWTGKRDLHGYGLMYYAGSNRHAHRAAYMMAHGPIPDGLVVRHRCDNPSCVRLDHLELGTHADNMRDMVERGRSNHTPRALGEAHGRAKLTLADVETIRDRVRRGDTYTSIAHDLGVSAVQVSNVARGRQWKHAEVPVATRRGRWRCNVLSSEQVEAARDRIAAGESLRSVARSFGVSHSGLAQRLHQAVVA